MSDEKTLDATPARVARARREGDVPRSSELVAAAAFGAAALTACAVASPIASIAREALVAASRASYAPTEIAEIVALGGLPAAAAACSALVAGVAQSGGLTLTAIGLRPSRLNPIEGLRRIASRETPAHAARALCAFLLAAAGIGPSVLHALVAAARSETMEGVATVAWIGVQRTLFVACGVGMLFAVAEYGLVRGSWLRRLRMSFDDLKREIREQEGDPHARGRRRSRHRELSRGALAKIREAAFVVANPTHVVVALAYRPPEIPVPLVLARAAGHAALRARELASLWRVPVIEQPALARALFHHGRAGSPIPPEHYVAVAEIVVALVRAGALAI